MEETKRHNRAALEKMQDEKQKLLAALAQKKEEINALEAAAECKLYDCQREITHLEKRMRENERDIETHKQQINRLKDAIKELNDAMKCDEKQLEYQRVCLNSLKEPQDGLKGDAQAIEKEIDVLNQRIKEENSKLGIHRRLSQINSSARAKALAARFQRHLDSLSQY